MSAPGTPVRIVAYILGGLGVASIAFYWYPDTWPLSTLIAALYPNVATSLLSISLTVLLIDGLYERRDAAVLKKRLVWEMGSSDSAQANRAVKELRDAGLLSNGTLHGADLSFANLEKANLVGASLVGVNLSNASLKSTDLTDANLSTANLSHCAGGGAILKGARLDGAILQRAKFPEATLDDADLSGGLDLLKTIFAGASLRGTKLPKARLEECDFLKADLTNAILSEANLLGANLEGANLNGTDLERADLMSVQGWESIQTITGARIAAVRNAPDGFKEWAMSNDAVE